MNCPKCESATIVTDTRRVNGGRERKRRCCNGHISFTREVFIDKWDYVDPRRNRYVPKLKRKKKLKHKKVKVLIDTKKKPKPKATSPKPPSTWGGVVVTEKTPLWVRNLWDKTL
jgi:hypothetical protein